MLARTKILITQKQVCEMLGISPNTLQRIRHNFSDFPEQEPYNGTKVVFDAEMVEEWRRKHVDGEQ